MSPLELALKAGGPLSPLAAHRQFILVKLVPLPNGKTDKLPINAHSGDVVSAHDPTNWLAAGEAVQMLQLYGDCYCVGFVFTTNDPFWFLDIDSAWDGAAWSPLAQRLCAQLSGAAVEVSQSGRGLHLFGTGACPPHACKAVAHGLEFYTEGRFVALTGTGATGLASFDASTLLPGLVAEFFPPIAERDDRKWSDQPVPEYGPERPDAEVIERALAARGSISGARFADLWNRNVPVLQQHYPADAEPFYDESSADGALAMHLAFWTGKNHEQMQRLMWQSQLVREKWSKHRTYVATTVTTACARGGSVYTGGVHVPEPAPVAAPGAGVYDQPVAPVAPAAAAGQIRVGMQLLSVPDQQRHFAGCVYVRSLHRVMVPGGDLLKPDQFKAMYGGYLFDLDGTGKTTKNAWEAFSESQAVHFPKVARVGFWPTEAPGAVIGDAVNTYFPVETPRRAGDISRFMRHVELLIPNANDREILLSYMAACVQLKGHKFQWCPLIQGTEGNGKTLFTRCVANAIGKRYVHWPKASQLDSQFNGWLLNKLFIGVEDVYVPASRLELWETLKPMITGGDGLEIQFKGADQISADVCANFMLNSNHKDAVRKRATDRRLAVFYTAQQSKEDCLRDGMTDEYFESLYDWLRAEGYAYVHEYLATRPITVNVFGKAPQTTSTEEAIDLSLGNAERLIQDAIDEQRAGFRADMVSTDAIRELFKQETGRDIGQGEMIRALSALDYEKHKAMGNSGKIRIGSKLVRIYVKRGSLAWNFESIDALRDCWVKAQSIVPPNAVVGPVPGNVAQFPKPLN